MAKVKIKSFYVEIDPMPAPRMVYSDRYGKKGERRSVVMRYHTYKDTLRLVHKIHLTEEDCDVEIHFRIPMPKSWSRKKKALMYGQPHQQVPDIDNLVKGFLDAVCDDDRHIYKISAAKTWSGKGAIYCQVFIKESWHDRLSQWFWDLKKGGYPWSIGK